jgi:hypothetical protein
MAMIDHKAARELIAGCFSEAEKHFLAGTKPGVDEPLKSAFDNVFASSTQAYREALIGCAIARFLDEKTDVSMPYVGQGPRSFNGRDIDEKVVNPFLQEKRVPCSRGPFLSVFRRSVRFDLSTRNGVRDKKGFDGFLAIVEAIQNGSERGLRDILIYLSYGFVQLREGSVVPLSKLRRISLEQCDQLINGLLETPSGGRFPMLLIASAFSAIKEHFGLSWDIDCQGINVADQAAGASGDITIRDGSRILLSAEITERSVERARVAATFNTKIAPSGIEDYLFFLKNDGENPEALKQARLYFSQGHEVNFVTIKNWIVMTLVTLGVSGRELYCKLLAQQLESEEIPKPMKVAWNEQIDKITGSA